MAKQNMNEQREQIIASLDIPYEFQQMGLRLASDKPRSSGKMEAYSMIRDERKPSAWIDVNTGMYGDSGPGGESSLSLFDFAVKYGGQPDFITAYKHFAERAGVQLTKTRKKKEETPDDKLEFVAWTSGSESLAQRWCAKHKQGVTFDALKVAGCELAYYPCYKDKATGEKKRGKNLCLALPCYGEHGTAAEPVAWVLYNITGAPLEVWRGKDVPPDLVKMKSIGPTRGAMMNKAALEQLSGDHAGIDLVWKTAGPSDMLTLMSAMPEELRGKHLVTCNASSETGDVLPHNAALLAGLNVAVIHDADQAGELGAAKWCVELNTAAADLRNVRLPYDVQPKGGKDLRDYLTEDGQYADLLALYESTAPHAAYAGLDKVEEPETDPLDTTVERAIMRMIRIDVMGELDGGAVKVFSEFHRKAFAIRDVGKMSFETLLQIAGPPAKQSVVLSPKDVKPGMVCIQDVKNAIALLAGFCRIGEQTELGAGCWAGADPSGSPSIIVVGAGEAAQWNGSRVLERVDHPRCKGQLLDFDSTEDAWYDFDKLKQYVDGCTPQFATETMHEAIRLFDLFRWSHHAGSIIATGLSLATWVQSVWEWRPQVAIIGPSNSGKTTLFNALAKLYGPLAIKSSNSSAAGIRQAIKTSSRVLLCDEFENSRYRAEILEMLRMSGRGDKVLRGTTNQRGQGFGLRHIAWVAAIEVGLSRAPDRNRFITLELVKLQRENQKSFMAPTRPYLADLGQRLLAAAIRYVHAAQPLAVALKDHQFPGVDERIIESYAVPAAMLSALQGLTVPQSIELMGEMVDGLDKEGEIADEQDLLQSILSAHIHNGKEVRSAGQLLESVINTDADAITSEEHLARCGLKWGYICDKDHFAINGERCLIIAYSVTAKHLLRSTPWEHQSIDQILRRIPGAFKSQRRVGGVRQQVVVLPGTLLLEQFLGKRNEEPSSAF